MKSWFEERETNKKTVDSWNSDMGMNNENAKEILNELQKIRETLQELNDYK